MDESADPEEEKKKKPDKVDLTALQDFNFASNWSETSAPPGNRDRDSRPPARKGRAPDRRARFDKDRPARPRREGPPRREGAAGEEGRPPRGPTDRRPPGRRPHGHHHETRTPPPEIPYDIQIVPEENIFAALTKRMRASLRTYELFEIARLIMEKPERFHLSFRYKDAKEEPARSFVLSVPDGLPFIDEEAALDHVIHNHADKFFKTEEVETDPPKGNFQYVTRCPRTGDVLGPPNFHRYQSILTQYHQQHFPGVPFERFRSELETVQDETVVQEWVDSMKKTTRYTPLNPDGTEGEPVDGVEKAREYLVNSRKEETLRNVKTARVPATELSSIPDEKMRHALEYYVSMQRRFPLETANALRGRLRRQNFYIYKKGSKGVSYVCAVKRRFREPGQVFSDSIQQLIDFLDQNPMLPASELPEKHLGLPPPPQNGEAGTDSSAREADPRMKRLMIDLRWLLSEGYVTEYSDGRLLVQPMTQQPKRQPKETSEKPVEPEESEPAEELSEKQETGEEAAERALTGDPDSRESAPTGEAAPVTPETEPAGKPITAEETNPEAGSPPEKDEFFEAKETPGGEGKASGENESAPDETRRGDEPSDENSGRAAEEDRKKDPANHS